MTDKNISQPKPSIIIVGLGPGAPELLTAEALVILSRARNVYLRTAIHPTVSALSLHLNREDFVLGQALHSFDHLYEKGESFEKVYDGIVDEVIRLSASEYDGVVYAVPGHPLVAEETVRRLLKRARAEGIATRVVSGVSFLDTVFSALELDPLEEGIQIIDATSIASFAEKKNGASEGDAPSERDPFAGVYRAFDPTRPALVAQVYGQHLAGQLKIALLELYPPEHKVTLVQSSGIPGSERVIEIPLYALDRQTEIDHLTSLYLPPVPPLEDIRSFDAFRRIVAMLRAPDGCPWDREQTHASLRRYLIEETYEAIDALDDYTASLVEAEKGDGERLEGEFDDEMTEGLSDPSKVVEELGDVLLQIVLHAQVGAESDAFMMEDVIESIATKLIRRHPHVFGDVQVSNSADVLNNWDKIKKQEKAASGEKTSLLASVPKGQPALQRALTIQKRVARTGFDWSSLDGPLAKVREELTELLSAETQAERGRELGDLLFAVSGLGRHLDLDPEESLREATSRFVSRFEALEDLRESRGFEYGKLSEAEILRLWEEAKGKAD